MSNENVVSNQIVALAKNLKMTGIDEMHLKHVLTQTVFKGANDEQLVALMIVANQYGLNPFTKEIYAFPSKGSITPIVSVDGWSRLINDNPNCDGIQFEQDDASATCKIYRKDRTHPTIVTEYLSECEMTNSPVWKKYPKRMLRHKALIQCARVAFGFSGIYDEDEAHRIDGGMTTVINDVEPVDDGYDDFCNEIQPEMRAAAIKGMEALQAQYQLLIKHYETVHSKRFWTENSQSLKEVAQQADIDNADNIIDAEVVEDEHTTTA